MVVTRHPGDIRDRAKEEFLKSDIAKQYNIVDVKMLYLESGWWKSRIEDVGDVDVLWGGGPTVFDQLYQEGLLAPLTSDIVQQAISQIPDVLAGSPMKRVGSDGKIYWVAAAIASFGFTVNEKVLQQWGLPEPSSWKDLGSPVYGSTLVNMGKPSVGVADPLASTSNTRMYEIILERYGWDEGWKLLTAMAANAKVYGGSADVRDAVIRGEIAVGITIDFYGYTAMMQNPDCKYIMPPNETIVNGDPIAMAISSKHPEAAQAFIAWVLTEGQKIWLDPDINRLPANPNVFNTPEGQQRPDLKQAFDTALHTQAMEFNDTEVLMYETAMRHYFSATLVELNPKLKQFWTLLLSKYLSGGITYDQFEQYVARVGAPLQYTDPQTGQTVTFTKEDAMRVNQILIEHPELTSQYATAWKNAMSARLDQLISELSD